MAFSEKPALDGNDLWRLARLVNPTTVARGREYALDGSVVDYDLDPNSGVLRGDVLGSGTATYEVVVIVKRAPDGIITHFDGRCTCPVGRRCKHAVALALVGGRSTRPPALRVLRDADDGRRPAGARPPAWRALVDEIAAADPRPAAADSSADLALQFELGTRTVTGRRLPEVGIKIRPLVRTAAGNWGRTGVTWYRLEYVGSSYRRSRPEHCSILRELYVLATTLGGSYVDQAVWLDAIASRRVWDVLAEAQERGVALLQPGKLAQAVILEPDPVRVVLDAHAAPDGALSISTRLRGRSGIIEPVTSVLVGRPAHGLAWWDQEGGPLHLARFAGSLPAGAAARLGGTPLEIPAAEAAEFIRDGLPLIRRRAEVESGDGSLELPEIHPDVVLCTVLAPAGGSPAIRWTLSSESGGERPLDDQPDRAAAEAIDLLAEVLRTVPGSGALLGDGSPLTGHPVLRPARFEGMAAATLVAEVLPAIEAVPGVEVRVEGRLPEYRELTEAPTITIGGQAQASTDWLDLAVEVSVAGEEVPFEELFVALASDATHLFLASGSYFSLDRPELRQLADLIREARALSDGPPGSARLGRLQVSLWEELCALGIISDQAQQWHEKLRAMSGADGVRRPLPEKLDATLRPYQEQGFQWLASRYENGIGGILADDMGLGKTLQALALVGHAREQGFTERPFLVVAPTSVVGNWRAEAERFAPGLAVRAVTETAKRSNTALADLVEGAGLVVTSYTLFRLEFDEYQNVEWAGLFLDEAQFAKNPASHNYNRARRLAAPFKLAMTGTPLENSLTELWALTSIVAPGLFPRPDRFEDIYRRPIERAGDSERLAQLRRRIHPVMLRRTKEQVASDLPAKQEQVLELDLHPQHRKQYQTHLQRERQKVLGLLGDMKRNRMEILKSLTVLRQAALDVALVADPSKSRGRPVPSTKLDALMDMLPEVVEDGHRVLVFSQFTRFLSAARRRVEDAGITCCYLDGRTRKRDEVIDRFRRGDAPVFLISLKAGGFGLNLTEADYCILLDPWWNPATEAQAVDRVHRIGQTRNVMVYRLVARETIEEKVMALKARKAALFESVVGGGGFEGAGLSAEDVAMLLS